jgi:flagellar hook-associated protein 3 FlgL
MRIATSLFYQRANERMGSLSEKADALQTSIATGKKLTGPSSDPAAYRQLSGIHRAIADDAATAKNITTAASLLTQSDDALKAIETQLQRVRELTVQANTGTFSGEQKGTIATELEAAIDDLLKMANTTDEQGQPLFGGSADQAYARVNGGISYVGSGQRGPIPIGGGSTVIATTTGDRVFGNVALEDGGTGDMFSIIADLASALRSGDDTSNALTDVNSVLDQVIDARASIGARGARLDLEQQRMAESAVTREETRKAVEDTDIAGAITELQKTLTVLQATQASFTKLTDLSLFNYLR